MSMAHHLPSFKNAGNFTGKNQSASEWLGKVKHDIASHNFGTVPLSMYVRAIDGLLEGSAAYWCDSSPAIKLLFENYPAASLADVKWLEHELIKRYPGEVEDAPVERRATRRRSYSLDVSAESEAGASRLAELRLGGRTGNCDERSEPTQTAQVSRKHRAYDDRDNMNETPLGMVEKHAIEEYCFSNGTRPLPSSSKNHNGQYRDSEIAQTRPHVFNSHAIDRTKIPIVPRGILKNSNSHYRQQRNSTYSSQEPTGDHSRGVETSAPFQSNHRSGHHRKTHNQQYQAKPHSRYFGHAYHPSESQTIYRTSRTSYREVEIAPAKSHQRYWSYVPLPATQYTPLPVQRSTDHAEDPLSYRR